MGLTPATIMLVIGLLTQSPSHGFIFVPQERLIVPTIGECWLLAVSISADERTPQVAMCVPGRPLGSESFNDALGSDAP